MGRAAESSGRIEAVVMTATTDTGKAFILTLYTAHRKDRLVSTCHK